MICIIVGVVVYIFVLLSILLAVREQRSQSIREDEEDEAVLLNRNVSIRRSTLLNHRLSIRRMCGHRGGYYLDQLPEHTV